MKNPLRSLVLLLIRGYQLLISPLMASHCRFYPTCSSYAQEAISKHGLIIGGYYTCRRLLRCHPWHEGGIDPVPARRAEQTQKQAGLNTTNRYDDH